MAERTASGRISLPPQVGTSSRRRSRRVADASRKRSAQSCDFCRKRRCKCVASPLGRACVMCQSHDQQCSYTIPRKTRFYGSLDDLSDRFRCLEAIVRGAFPDHDTSTVSGLIRLGERMGYLMPELSQKVDKEHAIEDLVKNSLSSSDKVITSNPIDQAVLGRSRIEIPTISDAGNEPIKRLTSHEGHITGSDESLGLIRDTTGREHFIGASGSLQFLGQLRRLLLLFRTDGKAGSNEAQGSSRLTATFTAEDAAQALETDGNQNEAQEPLSSGTGVVASETPMDHGGPEASPASTSSALTRDYTAIYPEDIEAILQHLPPRRTLDSLVKTYFKKIHPDFPLFHRSTFEEEYDAFLSRGRYSHVPGQLSGACSAIADPGWLGCLHMMLVFASLIAPKTTSSSQASDPVNFNGLRRHCLSLTRHRLLPHFISRCSLSNIRAILLLALYLHNYNERNAAWNLIGTAARASFAMGLHRSRGEAHFRPVEREVRKMVFCTLFTFEQFLASSLGRPSGLFEGAGFDDEDIQLVPPRREILGGSVDVDEEDGATELVLILQTILARARVSAAIKTVGTSSDEEDVSTIEQQPWSLQERSAREILQMLEVWRNNISGCQILNIPFITESHQSLNQEQAGLANNEPQMSFEELKTKLAWQSRSTLRSTLVLHMQYRYIAIMVTRASLLRAVASAQRGRPFMHSGKGVGQSTGSEPHLSEACVINAVQLCYLIILADEFSLVNGISAMDIFYAYCGVMVLILRTLPISVPTRMGTNDDAKRGSRCEVDLRHLIARTREVLMRVEKSSTMKRFARVVATFEDATRQDFMPRSNISSTFAHASQQPLPSSGSGRSRVGAGTSGQMFGHQNRFESSHLSTVDTVQADLNAGVGIPCKINMANISHLPGRQHIPTSAFQDELGRMSGTGTPTGLVMGSESFWHPSLLTSFDGEPEANSWMMNPFIGGGDGISMVDWGDLESIFMRKPDQ